MVVIRQLKRQSYCLYSVSIQTRGFELRTSGPSRGVASVLCVGCLQLYIIWRKMLPTTVNAMSQAAGPGRHSLVTWTLLSISMYVAVAFVYIGPATALGLLAWSIFADST